MMTQNPRVLWQQSIFCLFLLFGTVYATSAATLDLTILEPYAELHTAPGRSFPVFHVVKRGETIEIIKERTSWLMVRSTDHKVGWVDRESVSQSLTAADAEGAFSHQFSQKYLHEKLEMGLSSGSLEGQAMMTMRADYKLDSHLGAGVFLSRVSGKFTSSRIVGIHLFHEPFDDWRIAPLFYLGLGLFSDTPRKTLVDPADTDSLAAITGAGLRVTLSQRFFFRASVENYMILVNDNQVEEFQAATAGFSFLF